MNVVFLGLGGNLGDRLSNLKGAIGKLSLDCGEIMSQSSVYETEAWGNSSGNKYLNMVVKIKTELSSRNLISLLSSIEETLGRKREKDRNSDRTIDIDILFFNNEIINAAGLEVPHPRLHLRKFVLIPLLELARDFRHPILGLSIQELLNQCPDELEVAIFK